MSWMPLKLRSSTAAEALRGSPGGGGWQAHGALGQLCLADGSPLADALACFDRGLAAAGGDVGRVAMCVCAANAAERGGDAGAAARWRRLVGPLALATQCPVCLEPLRPGEPSAGGDRGRLEVLHCRHVLHAACMDAAASAGRGAECPVCRAGVATQRLGGARLGAWPETSTPAPPQPPAAAPAPLLLRAAAPAFLAPWIPLGGGVAAPGACPAGGSLWLGLAVADAPPHDMATQRLGLFSLSADGAALVGLPPLSPPPPPGAGTCFPAGAWLPDARCFLLFGGDTTFGPVAGKPPRTR